MFPGSVALVLVTTMRVGEKEKASRYR